MKSKITIGIFMIISLQIAFTSCQKNDNNDCQTEISFETTCFTFELNDLKVINESSNFIITNDADIRIEFDHKWEAEKALEVIDEYMLNEFCIIGSVNTFSYFLSDGQIPEGKIVDEDCVDHSACDLTVEQLFPRMFTIVEGDHLLYSSESEEEVLNIVNLIQHFQSNFGCYVGRPITNFRYLRK